MRELASKYRPGTAVSEKGNQRIDQIIRAARDTLIRAGYHGFTMRAVAAECEISVGNLNYYYASKADLLADLLEIEEEIGEALAGELIMTARAPWFEDA